MTIFQKLKLRHRAHRYAVRTEPDEIALVRSAVRKGQTVIDIGAHKAAFAWWMARGVGPSGQVVCFEPIPELASYLRDVASTYRDGRMQVVEAALSDHSGKTTLHFAGNHLGGASIELTSDVFRPPVDVAMLALDDWLATSPVERPVSFIKCDVESHELAVFRGAQQLLGRDLPTLLFESTNMHEGRSHNEPVFEYLRSFGYCGFFFNRGTLTPLVEFNKAKHRREVGNQNYVFAHPSRVRWQRLSRPYEMVYLDSRRPMAA